MGVLALILVVQVVNAAKYTMVVNVKDGTNIMGLNPTSEKLDFGDLSRNNGMVRYITLKNSGSVPSYVLIWKSGEISDLVKSDSNEFLLKPGEEKKLSFEIQVPPSAETKKYAGWVWIFRVPKII